MKKVPLNTIKTAKIISVAGHPFILLPLATLLALRQSVSAAQLALIVAAILLVAVFPLLFIIRRKVAAGRWSDHDISDSSERRGFYPLAIGVGIAATALFYLFSFPGALISGMLVSLALLLTAMIINHRSKISLHVIFAVYCAVTLSAVGVRTSFLFFLIVAAVGWSRVALKRHTLAQVLGGALLGAIGGIILLKINNVF